MAVPTIERRFFTWLKDLDVSFQHDCIFSTKRRFPMETPQKVTPKIYSGTNEYQGRIVLLYHGRTDWTGAKSNQEVVLSVVQPWNFKLIHY